MIDYEAIKAAKPMRKVLDAYGMEVRKGLVLCPFHQDQNPSLRVYEDGFYCFSCGAGGDTIKFVARYEGISNSAAAKRVAQMIGLALPEDGYRAREAARRRRAERNRQERERKAKLEQYRTLCDERQRLTGILSDAIPYSEEWSTAARRLPEVEGELDELYANIDE